MVVSSQSSAFVRIAMIAAALALASIFLANNVLGADRCAALSLERVHDCPTIPAGIAR
jgi:hypothetical protein